MAVVSASSAAMECRIEKFSKALSFRYSLLEQAKELASCRKPLITLSVALPCLAMFLADGIKHSGR